MKMRLNIERIVVDGVPLTRRERAQLAETLEHELARLLRERAGGIPGRSGTTGRSSGATPAGHGHSALGGRIAHEVLAVLPRGTVGPPPPRRAPGWPGRGAVTSGGTR